MNEIAALKSYAVPKEKLRWVCPDDLFDFECTSDIQPLEEFIGQERALNAIDFGLKLNRAGYNLFLTGLSGTGKAATIRSAIEKFIKEREKTTGKKLLPDDWCYVYNFSDPDRPVILRLEGGHGRSFHADMEKLLKILKEKIPRAFEDNDFKKQKQKIIEDHQKKHQEAMKKVEIAAREKNLMVEISQMGAAVVPLSDGEPMTRDKFLKLSENEQKTIDNDRMEMLGMIEETNVLHNELEKEMFGKLKEINRKAGEHAISGPFDEVIGKYAVYPEVLNYLNNLKEYTLRELDMFRLPEQEHSQPVVPSMAQQDSFMAFMVNVFVDNGPSVGPPVIHESNPNWFNMFGRVERKAYMGTYVSDHTYIKPGAVQRSNGGYLVLNIRDVLQNGGVWEGLKRVIRTKEVRVEDPWEQFGFIAPQGMRPQPMPVDIKIIVMGDGYLYQLLSAYDEDFWAMFKVKADFDHDMERSDNNMRSFGCFVRSCCDEEKLLPFDRSAVSRVLEHAARAAGNQERLSARFGPLKDLLIESDHWAKESGSEIITGEHVEKAVKENIHRLDLIAEHILRMITDGTLMVDVEGSVAGQVNGLSVYDMGMFSFGRPSRITAKTFIGRQGVINIERESRLSGNIHDKGVLILSGYLGWKYAQDRPLSLSASICFEQSYSGVEGDSASSTELYAILSSLADVPIRQEIAVTGSVNQKGEVQPIGGVNQKIEGFFDVCRAKGLTGKQGVMIPVQNVRHLMLREDVVSAVDEGKFHIYQVRTIDEGIEILTGTPAGQRQADGAYPEGSINFMVDKRLSELAEGIRKFYGPSNGKQSPDG